MIEISNLSKRFAVRRLGDADANAVLTLYRGNPQFFRYCDATPTLEQVQRDMHITPPGVGPPDKYYVGFYENNGLVAVMDLIDGYPDKSIAYIGFFMVHPSFAGRQIGSGIIRDTADHLKTAGKTAIRLAVNKGNPQATHFWKKNGFCVIKETERDGWPLLVAERQIGICREQIPK